MEPESEQPQVRVERMEPYEVDISGKKHIFKGFRIIDDSQKTSVLIIDGQGTEEKPYEFTVSTTSPAEAGRLLYFLANQNPTHPKRIYADINGVVLKFDPTEKVPVQIDRYSQPSSEDIGSDIQQRMLERIKPGLSNAMFDED